MMANNKYKKSTSNSSNNNSNYVNPNSSQELIKAPKEEVSFIKVVVRCRAPNPLEAYSGIGARTEPRFGKYVEVHNRQAERGKKYTFNQVLGPEVTQEELFNSVMKPIVDEVVQGFNCTVFAYGQTGTGKTYTMEGELNKFSENLGEQSGIIPRTLKHFFNYLEEQGLEYSMIISMMELYNEEVNDLLTSGESKNLNLFQDPNKGLMIPELEEFSVSSVQEAMEKLQIGTNRRHIAATKINERSSRSHSIFTITIHSKQYSSDGEELLKVGKLNLVDLAGSENIGRSGSASENLRKKETSSINTSLLTLGRVINALVFNEKHIPYRSSKLTRILQDSLGGHTKTCIIATITPSRMNIEETTGTLDYVQKAMRICNKPEVNKVMTKKELIQEYAKQIAGLKKQLAIQILKDGYVRIDPQEHEKLKDKETKHDEMVAKMKNASEHFDSQFKSMSTKLLSYENQLRQTNETLEHTKGKLKLIENAKLAVENELILTKNSLREQTHLTQSYANSESNLHGIGKDLVRNLNSSLTGIKALNNKMDLKESLIHKNLNLFEEFNEFLTQCSSNLLERVDSAHDTSITFAQQFKSLLSQFQDQQVQTNTTLKGHLQQRATGIKDEIDELKQSQQKNFDENQSQNQSLEKELQLLQQLQVDQFRKIHKTAEVSFINFNQSLEEIHGVIKSQREKSSKFVTEVVQQLSQSHDEQIKEIQLFYSYLEKSHQDQIGSLQKENDVLKATLENYRKEQAVNQEHLLSQITESIRQNFSAQTNQYEALVTKFVNSNDDKRSQSDEIMKTSLDSIKHFANSNKDQTNMIQSSFSQLRGQFESMDKSTQHSVTDTIAKNRDLEGILKDTFHTLSNDTETKLSSIHNHIHNTKQSQEQSLNASLASLSNHKSTIDTLAQSYSDDLDRIARDNASLTQRGTEQASSLIETLEPLNMGCKHQLADASEQSTQFLERYETDDAPSVVVDADLQFVKEWTTVDPKQVIEQFREQSSISQHNESVITNGTHSNNTSLIGSELKRRRV